MTDESNESDELTAPVIGALRAPVTVDAAVREAHIDAALAHFDALASPNHDTDNVVPLGPRRRPIRWVAAAASIVLVAAGVVIVVRQANPPATTQSADRAASGRAVATDNGSSQSKTAGSVPLSGASSGNQPTYAPSAADPTSLEAGGASLSQQDRVAPQAAATFAPATTCRAPRLRAALSSISTTSVDGQSVIELTYVSGPRGAQITTLKLDPRTCART